MGDRTPLQVIDRRYVINTILGQGGMGIVYHATDRLFNKDIALKQVLTEASDSDFSSSYGIEDYRLSLAREFKLSASLRHPNIVEVLEYGFDLDNIPYYTMEVLDQPLSILEYALLHPIAVRLELIVQLLNAIFYLHRRGIVHRDLKPANVLIENGQVKVLDFGLSVMQDHSKTSEEESDIAAGTLAYIAPEMLMGETPSVTSDLYAIGIMGYEMIAGKHPFDLSNPTLLINQILTEYPDINQLDVSLEIANIFMRLIHKDPTLRYASAQDVIEELEGQIHSTHSLNRLAIRESFLQAAKLVGRENELHQLDEALEKTINQNSSIWLIAGESGVGKSRLLEELRTRALVKGMQVMRGLADRVGSRPYELWLPILRWIAILLDDLTDDDIEFLSRFITDLDTLIEIDFPRNLSKDYKPEVIRSYILDLIRRLSQHLKRPILIILEDLHWAGEESLQILYELPAIINSIPSIMVLASFRDDERVSLIEALPDVPLLKLQRLNTDKIAELSRAMLGEVGSREHVVRLLERETEGNVYFLIEVVRALAEEVGQLDQIGRVTLPERVFSGGIESVINRRLQQIDPVGRELLQIASVMGRILNITLLQAIEPNVDMNRWLTDCLDAAVLEVSDGSWSFAHDKLRLGVLQQLTEDELRLVHIRIASSMEQLYGSSTTHINLLAEHWGHAGNTEREAHYVIIAGTEELRIGLYESAIKRFRRALDIIDDSDSRYVELELNIAQAHLGRGEYDIAREIYEEILNNLSTNNQVISAYTRMMLGDICVAQENLLQAKTHYQDSLLLYQEISNKSGVVEVLNRLGNVAYELNDEDAANEYFQQSLTLSRDSGDQWTMTGALQYDSTVSLIDTSEFEQVRDFLEQSLREQEQESNHAGIANVLVNLGAAAEASGKYDAAEEYFNRSLAIRQNLKGNDDLAEVYNHLAKLKLIQADSESSLKFAKLSLEFAIKSDADDIVYDPLFTIGSVCIQQGKLTDGLKLFTFLAYASDISEKLQDRAERHILELEVKLSDSEFESAWVAGKSLTLEQLVALLQEK